MVKKIALEEHFLCPDFIEYWNRTAVDLPPERREKALSRLTDFGEMRLNAMDEAGIARAVLGLAGPGVQAERDTATAVRRARSANDFLAREIAERADRYCGFAHLAMQDARAAADELERCMRELKFCGAMINGHTNGQYLDHPALYPFWERAEALNALIYLHPADPLTPAPVLEGHKGLRRATWEWTFETGSHALRLIFGGLFDRFPRARLGLGHLGETIPFLLWRFDSRAGPNFYAIKLGKPPSQYFKDNFVVTTSGMCSAEPLNCTLAALGHERVMFAADYPFESAQEAGAFMDEVPLAESVRKAIAADNVARYLDVTA
ncbi:MAG: amidohydrolase family protein [Xanthobacteraceae bacterium]